MTKAVVICSTAFVISITLRLLLYQHILLLVAGESQAEVCTSFLENLQEVCLHLRIERELAILCLVETALAERRIYVQIFGIARCDEEIEGS